MPTCCIPTQVEFANASNTSIIYDSVMQDKYGSKPRVYVYYYDSVTGEFYLSTFFTVIKFNGTIINIDHGGPSTGKVVIK